MQPACAAIGSEAGSAPEAAGSIRDRSSPEAGAEVGAAGESMQVPCAAIGSEAGSAPEAAGSCGGGRLATDRGGLGGSRVGGGGG